MDVRLAAVHGDPAPSVDFANKPEEAKLFFHNQRRREKSDSWPAFPTTRLQLLQHIINGKTQNVVFLSGDIHCSNVAEMAFEYQEAGKTKTLPLKAFSITSSAFYWPFPIADGNPNSYVHDSRDPQQWDPFPIGDSGITMHYRSFGYTQEDNFTRIDIDQTNHTLQVSVFDDEGEPITYTEGKRKKQLLNVLILAEWKL
jgi:alkaline phosphatase D